MSLKKFASAGINAVLMLVSTCLTLFLCEGAYRYFLYNDGFRAAIVADDPYFYATNKTINAIDGARRINIKNTSYNYLMYKGHLRFFGSKRINERGEVSTRPGNPDADVRILVTGDSFTSNPWGDPRSTDQWPEYFREDLADTFPGKSVDVFNTAVHGNGILDMIEDAAVQAEKYRPRALIVAFITDDLQRPAIYQFQKPAANQGANLASCPAVQPYHVFVDEALTEDRIKSLKLAGSDQDREAVASQYLEAYRNTTSTSLWQATNLASWRKSFLLDEVLHGDPYYSEPCYPRPKFVSPGGGVTEFPSYSSDPRFVENMQRIRKAVGDVWLVHIPHYYELKNDVDLNAVRSQGIMGRLLGDLEQAAGTSIISLYDDLKKVSPPEEQYYLIPEEKYADWHPNDVMLRIIARAIAQHLAPKLDGAGVAATAQSSH